ncbi:uncharacterized protein LOC134542785 [Bacillus rossius redtenbacheri]|uniref:uncharacterized protein LOC134542785 n=1 Tax=Bacillus rossius redtenbacheri TaxID=93214 RepID=UPI002FDEB394
MALVADASRMKVLLLACAALAAAHEARRLPEAADDASFKDVAVDVDDERFLQFSRLRVSGARLEGDYRLVSNSVEGEEEDGFSGDGRFSAPQAVVQLSRDLGPALVGAVRFFSVPRVSAAAAARLDGYLRRSGVDPGRLAGNTSDPELLAAAVLSRLAREDLGQVADLLLDVARGKMRASGRDELPLPDLDCLRGGGRRRRHRRKVFHAAGGSLKGVSRLSRAGAASLSRDGVVVTVTVPLRLERLEARYEAYGLQLSRLKVASGAASGEVRGSSAEVRVDVAVAEDGCCAASVRAVRFAPGEAGLRLEGLAAAHPAAARVDACFSALLRSAAAPGVEAAVREAVAATLREFRCPR